VGGGRKKGERGERGVTEGGRGCKEGDVRKGGEDRKVGGRGRLGREGGGGGEG